MRTLLLLSAFSLTACAEATIVELQGTLLDAPYGDAVGLGGATITTADLYGTTLFDTVSRPEGGYRVQAVGGQRTYVHVEADGFVPASFAGNAGLNPRHRMLDYEVAAVSEEHAQTLRDRYEGCPGNEAGATILFGEVRIADWVIDGQAPAVTTAQVHASTQLDDIWSACYLTDEEDSTTYDPEADRTGATGSYALFGADSGYLVVEVRYDVYDDVDHVTEYDLWVLEGGVAPRFPFYVEFASAP